VPQPAANEVVVAVDAVGLCGTDVHCYTGKRPVEYPMVLGHEITGRIVAAGKDVQAQRLGERVVVEPNIPCGRCALCTRRLGRICAHKQSIGLTRWGGLADYVTVPERFAWPIPEALALSDAVTIEPTAVAMHALSHAQVEPGAPIAIIGCGGVGLLLATVAIAQGHHVVAIEPNETRRRAALAAGAICALATSDAREAHTIFEQAGVVAIFECAGLSITTQLCLDAAPQGTRIVLVGIATEDIALNPLRFVRSELELRGALIYEHPHDFARTIDLIASGKLSPGDTAAPPQSLESLPALLEAMAAGKLDAKPLIALRPA
jgi:2-desacetyl-2-hydroxyethyl bacteriochlorophyllide A dehydrogenase